MKEPQITASSIEKFTKLRDYYNSLPEKIKENVESLSESHWIECIVKLKLCKHPVKSEFKAIYIPSDVINIEVREDKITAYLENSAFEIKLDGIKEYEFLFGKWLKH